MYQGTWRGSFVKGKVCAEEVVGGGGTGGLGELAGFGGERFDGRRKRTCSDKSRYTREDWVVGRLIE